MYLCLHIYTCTMYMYYSLQVSPDCFLAAASQQWRRGVCRVRALGYLHQLLSSEHVTMMAVEHLLVSVG